MRAVILLGLWGAVVAPAARVPDDPMPITVKAKAHFVTPGSPVTFTGTTVADGQRFDVRLTIVKPNAQPAIVAAKVDVQGNYTATFADTKQPGRYLVTALAPDALGHDTASFSVVAPQEFGAQAADAVQHIVNDGVEIETQLNAAVKDLPESPAKEEVEQRIETMDDSLHLATQRVQQFRQVMQKLADVQTRYPETEPVLHDMYVHLGEEVFRTQAEADARKFEILRELDQSRASGKVCDGLETMSEGFKMVSAVFNLASTPISIVRSFLTDYVAARLPH